MNGEVIFYTRPWFSSYYSVLGSAVQEELGCDISFISDYSVPDSYNMRAAAASKYASRKNTLHTDIIKPYTFDIIKRDRLLRTLDKKDAEMRIFSYYCAIVEYFSGRNVICVISATVDQYVVDLINLYCMLNNVKFIGYHISVLPKYTLFTARGEACSYRHIEDDEVDQVISVMLDKKFRPAYIPKPNRLNMIGLSRYARNTLRYCYYQILSFLPSTKLNYHVETSLREARKRLSFNIFRALAWHCEKEPQGKYLYLPLQFHPECNSEYWDRSDSYLDYEDKIIEFSKKNSPYWNIVVKEHPNMLGNRFAKFYLALKRCGCSIVHPTQDHRNLLKNSYAVVTLNSSAGIEGLCEEKVVICLSDPYYRSDYHLVKSYTEIVDPSEIETIMQKADLKESLRSTIRCILESSVPTAMPDINYRIDRDCSGWGASSAKMIAKQIPSLLAAMKNMELSADKCYTITKG